MKKEAIQGKLDELLENVIKVENVEMFRVVKLMPQVGGPNPTVETELDWVELFSQLGLSVAIIIKTRRQFFLI